MPAPEPVSPIHVCPKDVGWGNTYIYAKSGDHGSGPAMTVRGLEYRKEARLIISIGENRIKLVSR